MTIRVPQQNVSVYFSTELPILSHNDSSAATLKFASKEKSEATLAVGRFSKQIYAKVSRNFIVK
jgi:hypothetical protein